MPPFSLLFVVPISAENGNNFSTNATIITVPPTTISTISPAPTSTPAPSSNQGNSSTVIPTAHPTESHRHHHSPQQQWEIDSSVVGCFLLCVGAALLYRKRKRLPDYFLKMVRYTSLPGILCFWLGLLVLSSGRCVCVCVCCFDLGINYTAVHARIGGL